MGGDDVGSNWNKKWKVASIPSLSCLILGLKFIANGLDFCFLGQNRIFLEPGSYKLFDLANAYL